MFYVKCLRGSIAALILLSLVFGFFLCQNVSALDAEVTPSHPEDFHGTYTGLRAILYWNPPVSAGASEVISYRIYRAHTILGDPSHVGPFDIIAEVNANSTRFDDWHAQRYDYYYVVAVNGQGEGTASHWYWTGNDPAWWKEPTMIIAIALPVVVLTTIAHFLLNPRRSWIAAATILTIFGGVLVLALTLFEIEFTPSKLFVDEINIFSISAGLSGIGIIVCAMMYGSNRKRNRNLGVVVVVLALFSPCIDLLFLFLSQMATSGLAFVGIPFCLAGGILAIVAKPNQMGQKEQ